MKIFFISGLYFSDLENTLISKCKRHGIQNAPNVFQWAIVKGIIENDIEADIISYPFLPCFPLGYSQINTPNTSYTLSSKVNGYSFQYITFPLIKQVSISFSIINFFKCYFKNERNETKNKKYVIIVYSTISYILKSVIHIKKKYSNYNIKIVVIVTDLVDDALNFSENQSIVKLLQMTYENKAVKSTYRSIDKFILLSKYMVEKIPCAEGKNIVIEGICNECNIIENKDVNDNLKIILYSGTLDGFSGVRNLVDAFVRIQEPSYRLVIFGCGSDADYINTLAKKDRRIEFRGLVERSEVLRCQKQATLLVNPRLPDNNITRYSFPSKTIEYLSSGTPMLGYRLDGIPEEYYDYMFTIENDISVSNLSETISSILKNDSWFLNNFGKRARLFIEKEKNSKAQVAKILDFINY